MQLEIELQHLLEGVQWSQNHRLVHLTGSHMKNPSKAEKFLSHLIGSRFDSCEHQTVTQLEFQHFR